MAFVLTPQDGHDDHRWWGGCAWDSFSISTALRLDVRNQHRYGTGDAAPRAAGGALPATRGRVVEWWRREHAERLTRDHAPNTGYIAPARAVWQLAGPWYGDRIEPDFQPHTRERNQELLSDVGFNGPFWTLPWPPGRAEEARR
ncbi:hypothetical protein IWX90DRAFT_489980 [Phyllosticta citrichinensis]|uniref:Uncharacterized protein n=1 Tax=Phyllosticta citrichinensis TaxID=1130410 RepID=A0ABR1XGY3_9PEZI